MIQNPVREADTFIQHFAFCISFAKFQFVGQLSKTDKHFFSFSSGIFSQNMYNGERGNNNTQEGIHYEIRLWH